MQEPLLGVGGEGLRIEWCRKLVISAFGLFVITSEFTGTAIILWFGELPHRKVCVPERLHDSVFAAGHGTLEKFSPWLAEQQEAGIGIFLGVWVVAMLCCAPSTPLWLLGRTL